MQSTVSFAPLRPAGFVNFCGAGRGKACFLRGGAARISAGRGGASIPGQNQYLPGIDERIQNIDMSFHKLLSLVVLHDRQCEVSECLDQYGDTPLERLGDLSTGKQQLNVNIFDSLDCCQHQICHIATGHCNSVGMM